MMKWVLCVCVSVFVSLTSAEDLPECPGFTDEKLAEIKALVVTEDVHDQIVGDYSEIYGPKPAIEKDEKTCIKSSRTKVDDKQITDTVYLKGEWFGGEKNKTNTLEKVSNGVYYMKKQTGDIKAKTYILYAKNHVVAAFACKMPCKGHGSSDETKKDEKKHDEEKEKKKNKLPFLATIGIQSDYLKTPRDEEVQKSVQEAVEKLQAHKELLGDIIQYPNPC